MEIIVPDLSTACQGSGLVESKSVGTFTALQKQDGQRGYFVDRGVGSPRLVKSGSSTFTSNYNLETGTKVCMNDFSISWLFYFPLQFEYLRTIFVISTAQLMTSV